MSAVLTVKSNLDRHMIIELKDGKKLWSDDPQVVCLSDFS
jgi:hypothetical protein